MSFFGEVASALGFDEARLALGYSYICYNGEAVYVEGIKAALKLEKEEASFRLKSGILRVVGKNLTVKELCEGSATVVGEILRVEREAPLA